MRGRLAYLLAGVLVLLLCGGFVLRRVGGLEATALKFQNELGFQVGDEIVFLLLLETEAGQPLPSQQIDLYLDGGFAQTVETDALGAALFRLERDMLPGSYMVAAVYRGFQFYLPAAVAMEFTVAPAEIVVQTVPVIVGLEFSLEGQTFRTGSDGIARISVDRVGAYDLELLPNEVLLLQTGAEFKQWGLGGFEPVTTVLVRGETWMQAGFELSFPGNFVFVDQQGDPIDGTEIETVVLRGSDGVVYRFTAGETLRLRSSRILARLSGLDSVAVVHSVQSVIVDGVEVVHRGQQRFIILPNQPVEIELLFYDVRFFARDLLFGLPIGNGLELEYPDGVTRVFPFDTNGEITLTGLARGEYEARLVTRAGIAPRFPIVLSRDQEIPLPVVGYVDLLAGIAVAAGLIVGLPIFGRRGQILAFLKVSRRAAERSEKQ